tara:strand:+ start:2008 stop:2217 length:210 start_codon:yes stop_codon:yes gene_type:complete
MKFYRKKPDVIQAVQYDGSNIKEILDFVGAKNEMGFLFPFKTDFIVKNTDGSFEIYTEDIFKSFFEKIQ